MYTVALVDAEEPRLSGKKWTRERPSSVLRLTAPPRLRGFVGGLANMTVTLRDGYRSIGKGNLKDFLL